MSHLFLAAGNRPTPGICEAGWTAEHLCKIRCRSLGCCKRLRCTGAALLLLQRVVSITTHTAVSPHNLKPLTLKLAVSGVLSPRTPANA